MGYTDNLTVEQLERADWSTLTTLEKVTIAGELYRRAPCDDSLAKRRWVAERLGLPIFQLNRILWSTYGIRWPAIPNSPDIRRAHARA